MTTKEVTYNEIKKAITIAFMEDKDIVNLYDPNVDVNYVDDVIVNMQDKLGELGEDTKYKILYEKGDIAGYYIYNELQLISFSLNVKYRTRKYLRELFNFIKKECQNTFICTLWTKNKRAIRYLIKNGMEVMGQMGKDGNETNLVYLK